MTTLIAPEPQAREFHRAGTLRVALAGCGVVGAELLRALHRHGAEIGASRGVHLEVVRVLVRDAERDRDVPLSRDSFTSDVDEFIASDADVVVEAIGGLDPAARIARAALARGAHFVTANKALVATEGTALAALASEQGVALRFDAAVGGGVPALRLIESALGGARPRVVRGILNGTSNFVLTLLENGVPLEGALAEARRRGFAEADVTRDLDGRDAADKIAIVAWRAFGVAPERVRVRRRGLYPDPTRLVELARAVGGRLRLVAECALVDDGVVACVEPTVVDPAGAFGRTVYEGNRIEVDAGWSAPLTAAGPGAGGAPTATALLSDLLAPFAPPRPPRSRLAAVEDGRPLRWLVGTRTGADDLRAAFANAELPVAATGCASDGSWVIVESAPWRAIERALGDLDLPERPAIARLAEGVA